MAEELLYSNDHIWVKVSGDKARIGLSVYKVNELGEISYIQLPEEGDSIELGEPLGEIEGSEEVFEIVAPISGVVTAINEELIEEPEIIIDDPLTDGWLVEVSIEDPSELQQLMIEEEYENYIADIIEGEQEEEENN